MLNTIEIFISKCFDKNIKYELVSPYEYAKKLKQKFSQNKSLWYKSVIPAEKAEELIQTTNNDYSEIWETHCDCCFKVINKNTSERCYASQDRLSWLCESCYNKIVSTLNL